MSDPHTDKLSYALDTVRRGWPALPLNFITDKGRCSCGGPADSCKAGKHPLNIKGHINGADSATLDVAEVKRIWTQYPQANIGRVLGSESRIAVVDQDNRHGGEAANAAIEAKYGPWPLTQVALTGSGDGSRHRFFVCPNGGMTVSNLNKIDGLVGLELKVNGYVVAVGSVTAKPYLWLPGAGPDDVKIAPMPEWLVDLGRAPFKPGESTSADGSKTSKPRKEYPPLTAGENEKALAAALDSCAFLKHCDVDAKVLPEPEWQAMIELLVFFGTPGEAKIHELSQPYPTYSEEATNKKIANANKAISKKQLGPYTCQKIGQSFGFQCPPDCLATQSNTHTPVTMAMKAVTAREEPPLDNNVTMYIYNASGQNKPETKRDKSGTHIGITSLTTEEKDLSRFLGLSKRVKTWVEETAGWWETRELDTELGIVSAKDKENRKKILQRLCEQGVVERHQKVNRQWRYVNTRATSLEFKTATTTGALSIKWPMGIENKVNLFPGNLVVVAGSPNAGKTAFNLNFIYLNQKQFPITYICSEMGAVELRNRLEQFPGMAIEDWSFKAIERASDFADVIVPDVINIVDYLEMTNELYEVNTHLTAISHKIGSGLGIVSIQKKINAVFGRGAEFSLEKPKLYLSMDKGVMRIVKGKSWAIKNVDPHGLEIHFKIVGGCLFQPSGDWDWRH